MLEYHSISISILFYTFLLVTYGVYYYWNILEIQLYTIFPLFSNSCTWKFSHICLKIPIMKMGMAINQIKSYLIVVKLVSWNWIFQTKRRFKNVSLSLYFILHIQNETLVFLDMSVENKVRGQNLRDLEKLHEDLTNERWWTLRSCSCGDTRKHQFNSFMSFSHFQFPTWKMEFFLTHEWEKGWRGTELTFTEYQFLC